MKSYIKIYGPPIVKAIKALEKVAVDMPEVCIMHTDFAMGPPLGGEPLMNYFGGPGVISEERCGKIISKSRESLGEYDFFFEWLKNPTKSDLHSLMEKIDDALSEVGVRYTITTK
jgi:hypothetical protein